MNKGGFIKTIILTVIALVLINIFFNFDIVDYLDQERLLQIWHNEILRPLKFIWNDIIVGFIWEHISKLFS